MRRLYRAISRLIMVPFQVAQTALQQATEKGSRSTVLRPLGWLLPVWVTGILAAVHEKADLWIIGGFSFFAGLTGLIYLGTYVYCLLKNKETLLRSETFSIQERLIERGFLGPAGTADRQFKSSDLAKLQSVEPISSIEMDRPAEETR